MVENGESKGRDDWYDENEELKAFCAISFYMGMKWQPNMKSYWVKS